MVWFLLIHDSGMEYTRHTDPGEDPFAELHNTMARK